MDLTKYLLFIFLLCASTANATLISQELTNPTDFFDFEFQDLSGNRQYAGSLSVNEQLYVAGQMGSSVTLSTNDILYLGAGRYGLGDNGVWDHTRGSDYVGTEGRHGNVIFDFGESISAFSLFMNYSSYQSEPDNVFINTYDSDFNLIDSFNIGNLRPIITPGAVNAGSYVGVDYQSNNISFLELNNTSGLTVFDSLSIQRVDVPEPSGVLMIVTSLLFLTRKRKHVHFGTNK